MKHRRKWIYFHSHHGILELLEPRNMLAGHAIAPHVFHAFRDFSAPVAVHAGAARHWQLPSGQASETDTEDASQTTLSATLTDTSGSGTGTVTYRTGSQCGTTSTKFTVSVNGTTADTPLDVAINGSVVGQIKTDGTGAGTLTLSSKDSTLPANFPTDIVAGATVTVGTLTGTLAVPTSSGDSDSDSEDNSDSSSTNLAATLTDSSGMGAGTATFSTCSQHGTAATAFAVSVTGAIVNSTLEVAIDGTVVGQLPTDDTGAGTLTLSSKASTLPSNFPAVSSGSVVTVGTLSGTLADATTGNYSSSLRFAHRR